tara:strand:- start:595 stop:1737 length:1143 start_codon:yes stop_codon:yes gene_type:complete
MSKIKHILFFFLTFIWIEKLYAIDTNAQQAIVIDYNTNEVLFEKNADQIIPPASMTKIMTVFVAFDRLNSTDLSVNDTCIISPKAYRMGGSRTFLEIDDQVTINDLLRGIIIQSGNDASVALAECLSGTEKAFSKLMNIYAKKLNLKNTNFKNSSGWPMEDHYSTVRDIGILSNELIKKFPNLYSYFSEKYFTYNDIKQPNRNKLLTNFQGADGLKTGYVKSSGWGISTSAVRNERRITIVIDGTNSTRSRLNESINLFQWAFSQTSQKKLLKKNQIIKNVDVWLGSQPSINLIVENDIISTISFDQLKSINANIEFEKPIPAPIKKGQKLGEMKINISSKNPIIVPLVAQNEVTDINPIMRIFAAIKYIIFGTSFDEKK